MNRYRGAMRGLFARLLVVLSVLLMPFGMPAAATTSAHHPTASMPMEHCPDQSPKKVAHGGFTECTMACAAALPAVDAARPGAPMIMCAPEIEAPADAMIGLHPETATPPPRRS